MSARKEERRSGKWARGIPNASRRRSTWGRYAQFLAVDLMSFGISDIAVGGVSFVLLETLLLDGRVENHDESLELYLDPDQSRGSRRDRSLECERPERQRRK